MGEVTFANTGRADEEDVAGFFEVVSGGELVDLFAIDLGVEAEVEVLEGSLFSKVGTLFPPIEGSLGSDVEFVLEEEFKEFGVAELIASGFLEAYFEAVEEAGESEGACLVG